MKKLLLLISSLVFLAACSSEPVEQQRAPNSFFSSPTFKLRFQVDPLDWNDGVRVAQYRTGDVDVTYKILKADAGTIYFKVYVSNIGKKNLVLDSSLFNITSISSKKLYVASTSYWADEKNPVAKVSLLPGQSAASELKFAVTESAGRWTLKNKITAHSFNFIVAKL